MARPIPQQCIDFIKVAEGKMNKVYLDTNGVPTVGWGHQLPGSNLKVGTFFTDEEIVQFLKDDTVARGALVEKHVKVPLNDNQFSALISFIFNLGDVLPGSTLLKLLNAGDYAGAAEQFLRWDDVNGKPNANIEARRKKEHDLFLS